MDPQDKPHKHGLSRAILYVPSQFDEVMQIQYTAIDGIIVDIATVSYYEPTLFIGETAKQDFRDAEQQFIEDVGVRKLYKT